MLQTSVSSYLLKLSSFWFWISLVYSIFSNFSFRGFKLLWRTAKYLHSNLTPLLAKNTINLSMESRLEVLCGFLFLPNIKAYRTMKRHLKHKPSFCRIVLISNTETIFNGENFELTQLCFGHLMSKLLPGLF